MRVIPQVTKWHRSVNFQNTKSPKYTFCIEFNSEYHDCCDIWRHCRWKHPQGTAFCYSFLFAKGLGTNATHSEMDPTYADNCNTRRS